MSYSIDTVDYAALAADMLDDFKKHARVDFDDDDTVITKYLKWSAATVEAVFGFRVGSAVVAWLPEPIPAPNASGGMADMYPLPVVPYGGDLQVLDDDDTDITANYLVRGTSLVEPAYLLTKDGTAFPENVAVSYAAGYASGDDMPPNVEAAIYRVAAHLYENRESVSSINLESVPLWLNDLLVGLWVPRA